MILPKYYLKEEIPAIILHISMMNDILVHFLLGSEGRKEQLINFINAVRRQTHQPLIRDIILKNPFNLKQYRNDKDSILDFKAQDEQGNYYNIEFQTYTQKYYIERAVYYLTKVHGSQLMKGDNYNTLHQSISITLTTECLFPTLTGAFQSFHLASDTDPKIIMTPNVQFHFLILSNDLNNHTKGLEKELVDWMNFFNIPNTSEAKMSEILSSNNVINRAWEETKIFVSDRDNQAILEAHEKARRDRITSLCDAKEEGIMIGEKRGLLQGKAQLLVLYLENRFDTILPESIKEKLGSITDEVTMTDLSSKTFKVNSVDEFKTLLGNY